MFDFLERTLIFILLLSIPYVIMMVGFQDLYWPLLIWDLHDPVARMLATTAIISWFCISFIFCYFTGNGPTAEDYLDNM